MKIGKALGAVIAALVTVNTAHAGGDSDLHGERPRNMPTSVSESGFQSLDNQTIVKPGALTQVRISRSDVNMVECKDGPITDRTYSEEKPLIYKTGAGKDGSIGSLKLVQQQVGGETQFYVKPVELYVTCGGSVYSLMLVPEAVPTQHVILSPGRGDVLTENIAMFSELSLEQAALSLIDKVQYETQLPASFSVSKAGPAEQWERVLPFVKARLVKSVKPDGIGLTVHEYLAYADQKALMKEFDFVSLSNNTFAVRMEKESLRPKETTRVYIVERLWR